MQQTTEAFAHVLLFACPQCNRPLASACASAKRSLEDADAHYFNPHCHCGWTGPVVGLEAVKHWVHPWQKIDHTAGLAQDADGTCNGKSHAI